MRGPDLRWVESANERESICRSILSQLPEWFGIPESTVELYVLGVLKDHHRSGIGPAMLRAIEDRSRQSGFRLLEVKTLAPDRESAEYERTRKFYEQRGFLPLETLTELWGAESRTFDSDGNSLERWKPLAES